MRNGAFKKQTKKGKDALSDRLIGVLDIQGSVEEHFEMLKKCGVSAVPVKTKQDLEKISGLIIPGGESTTIGALLSKHELDYEIKKRVQKGTLTIWGTCAGAILLAKHILTCPLNRKPQNLAVMDITVSRNGYGRQVDSFETDISVSVLRKKAFKAIFIRAPRIKRCGKNARILAQFNGEPAMIQQGSLLATTFHPELTDDKRIHEYFISLCKNAGINRKIHKKSD